MEITRGSQRGRGSRARGQTLIEFALLAPLIFVFLFTIVDFGISLDRRITLQHAVREGARAAGVQGNPAAGLDATLRQSQNLLKASDVTICYIDENNDNVAQALEPVKVSATFTYHFTIPFKGFLKVFGVNGDPGIDMTPNATSPLENEPAAGVTFTRCPP